MISEAERKYFACLCLNIPSLGNSKNYNSFVLLLKSLPISPIFLGITNTWLRNGQQVPQPYLCLLNYNFYSINRSKTKGEAIGAYMLKTQTHWIRNELSIFKEAVLECIFFELKLGNVNIFCDTLYLPPLNKSNSAIDAFIFILEEALNNVKKENKLLYVMSDYNFDLLDPDCRTDVFTDLMFGFGNIPLMSIPTKTHLRDKI